jgi:ribonuclease J
MNKIRKFFGRKKRSNTQSPSTKETNNNHRGGNPNHRTNKSNHSTNRKQGNYRPTFDKGSKLKIIPIGGHNEVGKNMMAIEYGQDIVVVDCGLQFPEEYMLGIDYVVPDTTYLEENKHKIRGMIMTHGHLDHVGGLRHILPKLGFPVVYGLPLTLAITDRHIKDMAESGGRNISKQCILKTIKLTDKLKLGGMEVEFFHQNHSIPDSMGVVVRTKAGAVVHTGDFKFDFNPAYGPSSDFQRIAEVGRKGVLVLASESTNAAIPGHTVSEKIIAENLHEIIEKTKGRLIIASFSSLMGRINQLFEYAHKFNRHVFLVGRSMVNNVEIGQKLGILTPPKGVIRKIETIHQHPDHKAIILCTGSQGEGLAALSRASRGEHKFIKIQQSDTVVLSSSPIIGNEKAVVTTINNLARMGVNTITNKNIDVHTSGHAKQEDLKLMLSLLKPKFLIPIHGEPHMRMAHRELAKDVGIEERNVALMDNGDIFETDGKIGRKSKSKVPANNIFIEALIEGKDQSKIQGDRMMMSKNGIIIIVFRAYADTGNLIADPHITSRGFTLFEESKALKVDCIKTARKAYEEGTSKKYEGDEFKDNIKRNVGRIVQDRMRETPIIMPIIVKI